MNIPVRCADGEERSFPGTFTVLWDGHRRPIGAVVGGRTPVSELEQMMTTIVVRYQAKAERADENQRLIEAVFAELDEHQPEGFTYKVFRLDDDVTFVHIMIEHDVEHPESLQDVAAFQAFVAEIDDRCDVVPQAMRASIVGGYR
jgi:hypothetical protein